MSREAINKAREEITKGWLTNDAELILKHVTDDITLLGAHEQPVQGKTAAREYLNGTFAVVQFTKLPTHEDREVIVSGDLAVEYSSYDWEWTMTGSDEPISDQGTFMGIWRKQPDGSWKESHIMWHSWSPLS